MWVCGNTTSLSFCIEESYEYSCSCCVCFVVCLNIFIVTVKYVLNLSIKLLLQPFHGSHLLFDPRIPLCVHLLIKVFFPISNNTLADETLTLVGILKLSFALINQGILLECRNSHLALEQLNLFFSYRNIQECCHASNNIAKIWEEIVNDHDEGGCIVSVMMYDAMYYQAKAQHCAIAVDGAPIYDEWNERANCWFETEESYRAIGFGRNDDQISKPSFLCVRNFKTDDDVSKKVHFLPTDKGRYVWDLGSGKMALVDTETGTQMRNIEFPNTVFTDHAALLELVETIRTKSRVYAPIVMDGSWQENASAIAQVEKLLDQKPITLTPEQKCVNKAIFVHKQFRRDGYIQQIVQDHYDDPTGKRQPDPLFVYMMTDGDSAYGIVLLADGEREDVCGVYNADHQNVTSVWEQVLEDHDYKYAIQHVILLDDLYRNADTDHVHKEGAPLYDSWDGVEMGDWLYRESDFKNIGFYVTDAKGYKGGTRSSCPSFLPLSSFQTGDYEDELIMRYPHPLPTEHNSVWRMESEMLSLVHTPTGETLWACEIDPTQDIRQIIDPILNEAHP